MDKLTREQIEKMSDEELRVNLAKALGWKFVNNLGSCGGAFWVAPRGQYPRLTDMVGNPPDYLNDITATFDVIQELRVHQYNVRVELHKTYSEATAWAQNMTEYGPHPITYKADTVYRAVACVGLLAVSQP